MQFLLEKSAGRHLFYSAMVILPENNTGYKNSIGAMLTPAGWQTCCKVYCAMLSPGRDL